MYTNQLLKLHVFPCCWFSRSSSRSIQNIASALVQELRFRTWSAFQNCFEVTWQIQTGDLIGLPIFRACTLGTNKKSRKLLLRSYFRLAHRRVWSRDYPCIQSFQWSSRSLVANLVAPWSMDKFYKGWFTYHTAYSPSQAFSLEVEDILYQGKSQYQEIVVLQRWEWELEAL